MARREQPGEVERAVERWATERAVWWRDHAAVEPSQRFVAQSANTGMPKTLRKTSPIRGGARKSRQLIKASDVSEVKAQRLAKAVLDTVTQISGPRMAGALAELRQKQAEPIEAINGWQHEQWPENATKEELDARATREFTENRRLGRAKIAGNMRHRPTLYQCLIVGAQTTSARSIAIAQLHGARAVQTLRRRGAGDMPPGST